MRRSCRGRNLSVDVLPHYSCNIVFLNKDLARSLIKNLAKSLINTMAKKLAPLAPLAPALIPRLAPPLISPFYDILTIPIHVDEWIGISTISVGRTDPRLCINKVDFLHYFFNKSQLTKLMVLSVHQQIQCCFFSVDGGKSTASEETQVLIRDVLTKKSCCSFGLFFFQITSTSTCF